MVTIPVADENLHFGLNFDPNLLMLSLEVLTRHILPQPATAFFLQEPAENRIETDEMQAHRKTDLNKNGMARRRKATFADRQRPEEKGHDLLRL